MRSSRRRLGVLENLSALSAWGFVSPTACKRMRKFRYSSYLLALGMTTAQQERIAAAGCDVRFDNLTRQLYATDASIYQIEPAGAAFPRNANEASAVIKAAADAGISCTPRGAGPSLVGNAIGEGLIVDFSRHNRQIDNLNIDNRTVRVGAGVVLDQLNAFLRP